jgi:hypothetical protein
MDPTSNETSGGSAAQTPNSNPQPESVRNVTPDQEAPVISPQFASDDPISLREVSEAFKCSVHSLKSNVKSGRLPSMKAAGTAPYLVRPSAVEKFLRETSAVRSIFHPGHPSQAANSVSDSHPAAPAPDGPAPEPVSEPAEPTLPPSDIRDPASARAVALREEATHPPDETPPEQKRKRNRRGRRKKAVAAGHAPSPQATPELKKLAMLSERERSKFAAVLHEILGLILPS